MDGELTDMSERQILYRLVADVAALKNESDSGVRSREMTRKKVEAIEAVVNAMDRKLDRFLNFEDRLKECEAGVKDYRALKQRSTGIVLGVGAGAGGIGGIAWTVLSKLFGG